MALETLRELNVRITGMLSDAGVPEPAEDAWVLLSEITGLSRADFFLHREEPADRFLPGGSKKRETLFALVEKRRERIPVQHLIGHWEFCGLDFAVSKDVLIPRQDTETLVEEALERIRTLGKMRTPVAVLDLCTGSGCIGISLQKLSPTPVAVTLSDLSGKALSVAEENAKKNEAKVTLCRGDLFDALPKGAVFDVLVSNPPYIPTADIEKLSEEVRDHDPRMALDGGASGLDFYRRIAVEGPDYVRSGGAVCVEIGYDQGESVPELFTGAGWTDVRLIRDLSGQARVVTGVRP